MKKNILLQTLALLAVMLLSLFPMNNAQAQEAPGYRHIVSAGVGLWPVIGHYDPYYDKERNLMDEEQKHSIILSANYQYMMNRHWSLGGTISMGRWRQYMRYIDSGEIADKKGDSFLTAMFSTRYYWRTKNWVRTYSGISFGVGYGWEEKYDPWPDEHKIAPSWQLTMLGIEVGKGRIIGFGEFGFGMTGWLVGGIGYRF